MSASQPRRESGARLHSLLAGVAAYDLPDQLRGLVGEMGSTHGERVCLGAGSTARVTHRTHPLATPAHGSDGRQRVVLAPGLRAAITGVEITRRDGGLMTTTRTSEWEA